MRPPALVVLVVLVTVAAAALPASAQSGGQIGLTSTLTWQAGGGPIVVCPGNDGTRLDIVLRNLAGNALPNYAFRLRFSFADPADEPPSGTTCPTSVEVKLVTDGAGAASVRPYLGGVAGSDPGATTCFSFATEVSENSGPFTSIPALADTSVWKTFDLDGDCHVGTDDQTLLEGTFGAQSCPTNYNGVGPGPIDLFDAAVFSNHVGHGQLDEYGSTFTDVGTSVEVSIPPVTITFAEVTSSGVTEVVTTGVGPQAPDGFQLQPPWVPDFYDVNTNATYVGPVTVCIEYVDADIAGDEADLRIMHDDGAGLTDVTTSHDPVANVICGTVPSLSPFVLAIGPGGATGVIDAPVPVGTLTALAIPNPSSGATSIRFALPQHDRVTLRVFDVQGRAVAVMADGDRAAGWHAVTWNGRGADGRPVPAGVYFVRLDAGSLHQTTRIVRVR